MLLFFVFLLNFHIGGLLFGSDLPGISDEEIATILEESEHSIRGITKKIPNIIREAEASQRRALAAKGKKALDEITPLATIPLLPQRSRIPAEVIRYFSEEEYAKIPAAMQRKGVPFHIPHVSLPPNVYYYVDDGTVDEKGKPRLRRELLPYLDLHDRHRLHRLYSVIKRGILGQIDQSSKNQEKQEQARRDIADSEEILRGESTYSSLQPLSAREIKRVQQLKHSFQRGELFIQDASGKFIPLDEHTIHTVTPERDVYILQEDEPNKEEADDEIYYTKESNTELHDAYLLKEQELKALRKALRVNPGTHKLVSAIEQVEKELAAIREHHAGKSPAKKVFRETHDTTESQGPRFKKTTTHAYRKIHSTSELPRTQKESLRKTGFPVLVQYAFSSSMLPSDSKKPFTERTLRVPSRLKYFLAGMLGAKPESADLIDGMSISKVINSGGSIALAKTLPPDLHPLIDLITRRVDDSPSLLENMIYQTTSQVSQYGKKYIWDTTLGLAQQDLISEVINHSVAIALEDFVSAGELTVLTEKDRHIISALIRKIIQLDPQVHDEYEKLPTDAKKILLYAFSLVHSLLPKAIKESAEKALYGKIFRLPPNTFIAPDKELSAAFHSVDLVEFAGDMASAAQLAQVAESARRTADEWKAAIREEAAESERRIAAAAEIRAREEARAHEAAEAQADEEAREWEESHGVLGMLQFAGKWVAHRAQDTLTKARTAYESVADTTSHTLGAATRGIRTLGADAFSGGITLAHGTNSLLGGTFNIGLGKLATRAAIAFGALPSARIEQTFLVPTTQETFVQVKKEKEAVQDESSRFKKLQPAVSRLLSLQLLRKTSSSVCRYERESIPLWKATPVVQLLTQEENPFSGARYYRELSPLPEADRTYISAEELRKSIVADDYFLIPLYKKNGTYLSEKMTSPISISLSKNDLLHLGQLSISLVTNSVIFTLFQKAREEYIATQILENADDLYALLAHKSSLKQSALYSLNPGLRNYISRNHYFMNLSIFNLQMFKITALIIILSELANAAKKAAFSTNNSIPDIWNGIMAEASTTLIKSYDSFLKGKKALPQIRPLLKDIGTVVSRHLTTTGITLPSSPIIEFLVTGSSERAAQATGFLVDKNFDTDLFSLLGKTAAANTTHYSGFADQWQPSWYHYKNNPSDDPWHNYKYGAFMLLRKSMNAFFMLRTLNGYFQSEWSEYVVQHQSRLKLILAEYLTRKNEEQSIALIKEFVSEGNSLHKERMTANLLKLPVIAEKIAQFFKLSTAKKIITTVSLVQQARHQGIAFTNGLLSLPVVWNIVRPAITTGITKAIKSLTGGHP